MSLTSFKIIAHGSSQYERAVRLREDILRKPLGLTLDPKELAAEKDYVHIAGFIDGALCATALLINQGDKLKMRQVAVSDALRGQGIGSALVAFCETYARKHGFTLIHLNARETAIAFYLKNGYIKEGEFFEENTIPHVKMHKLIAKQ